MSLPGKPQRSFPLNVDPVRCVVAPDYRSLQLTLDADQPDGEPQVAPGVRHSVQRDALAKLGSPTLRPIGGAPPEPLFALDERVCRYRPSVAATRAKAGTAVSLLDRGSQRAVFGDLLYLFNALIALEWIPSEQTLQRIMSGVRSAADFLFDATDGQMTFGQVVIGGPELMPAADIQILASTRLHPRSWVNGLNDGDKYTPIRIGRGLWNKNYRSVIPWDAPEGYRTLVHEWGHYALNLVDEYLDSERFAVLDELNPYRLLPRAEDETPSATLNAAAATGTPANLVRVVVPHISLPVESIMATLEGSSEIVPQQWRSTPHGMLIQQRVASIFPGVSFSTPENPGPNGVPAALPQLYRLDTLAGAAEEFVADMDNLPIVRCWAYILDTRQKTPRLVAQGSIEARSITREPVGQRQQSAANSAVEQTQAAQAGGSMTIQGLGFGLLGYRAGDELLLVGDDPSGRLTLLLGPPRQRGASDGPPLRDVTPPEPTVISVIPHQRERASSSGGVRQEQPSGERIIRSVRVRAHGGKRPDSAWLFELGRPSDPQPISFYDGDGPIWESEPIDVSALDGQVLLGWSEGARDAGQAWLVAEFSQGGGPRTHVHAPESPISAGSSEGNVMLFFNAADAATASYADLRIVTTRNYASPEGDQAAPRSYLFSLASTGPIPAALDPTVVLYFDRDSIETGHELAILRYDGGWKPVPTYQQTGTFVLAWPMRAGESGPYVAALAPDTDRAVEYLRIYSVRSGALDTLSASAT